MKKTLKILSVISILHSVALAESEYYTEPAYKFVVGAGLGATGITSNISKILPMLNMNMAVHQHYPSCSSNEECGSYSTLWVYLFNAGINIKSLNNQSKYKNLVIGSSKKGYKSISNVVSDVPDTNANELKFTIHSEAAVGLGYGISSKMAHFAAGAGLKMQILSPASPNAVSEFNRALCSSQKLLDQTVNLRIIRNRFASMSESLCYKTSLRNRSIPAPGIMLFAKAGIFHKTTEDYYVGISVNMDYTYPIISPKSRKAIEFNHKVIRDTVAHKGIDQIEFFDKYKPKKKKTNLGSFSFAISIILGISGI